MPNKRDLQLGQYEISKYRYRELYNFCMQYKEWKERLAGCYAVGSQFFDGMPKGGRRADPTAGSAERAIKYRRYCEMVEQAAIEADGVLYPWIIKAVTEGLSWEILQPPCGINQFYGARKKFFFLLDLRNE